MRWKVLLAPCFFAAALAARAQGVAQISLPAAKLTPPHYVEISFVTEGPAYALGEGKVHGRFQRIVVLERGLAYDQPTLRFETITYGDELCCRRVTTVFELDLNDLDEKGVALPSAEATRLQFVGWQSSDSAQFRFGQVLCGFTGIGKPKIKVSCKNLPPT
jgi:hypothetical protein